MNLLADPWTIGLLITLILFAGIFVVLAIPYARTILIYALALPQAIFKKAFGDPPSEDGHH